MAEPTKPPMPTANSTKVEFVIEIGDEKNRNVIWPLDNRLLRGRWVKSNIPPESVGEKIAKIPDLPGVCIRLNSAKRAADIFDPLASPQNKALLERAQQATAGVFGPFGPEELATFDELDNDGIKSWCYWARRLVDAGTARVKRGAVPEMDEIIAMPGRYATNNHDQGVNAERSKEKPDRPYKPLVKSSESTREFEAVI